MFPIERQSWIIQELADVLLAAMVQVLVPRGGSHPKRGELILATEFLHMNETYTRELLLSGQYERLREEQRSSAIGWTLNQTLKKLVASNDIDESDARKATNDIMRFMKE